MQYTLSVDMSNARNGSKPMQSHVAPFSPMQGRLLNFHFQTGMIERRRSRHNFLQRHAAHTACVSWSCDVEILQTNLYWTISCNVGVTTRAEIGAASSAPCASSTST